MRELGVARADALKTYSAEELKTRAEKSSPAPSDARLRDLSAGVWQAFANAIADAKTVFGGSVPKDELVPFLESLEDAVRCVVVGLPATPASPPASISTTQVLDSV